MGNQGCCKAAELCSALVCKGKEGKEAALCTHIIPRARVSLICKKRQALNFGGLAAPKCELTAAKQVRVAWWLSQACASLWAAPTGCAANGN